ncbi:glycosyltransferase family 2 protein [Roseovarius aestuariivivens]|uniref:glycosyltransferase family 2 protein n=1 Tax=Roseovarius aestuariivivens TaxID=1888910 RepID=UPI001081A847|nr:glycosyltransferase family A protein [Roseovarius aestuariivivens]
MSLKSILFHLARLVRSKRTPGYIDHFDTYRVAGWAYDPSDRASPALLSLHVDGRPEVNVVADIPREDVQAAGLGPLRCGFETALPRRLRDGRAHVVELRLGSDGPLLSGGRLKIPARDDGEAGTAGATPGDVAGEAGPSQGLVFFDRARGALSGWATGCASVSVYFDGGVPQTLTLDRVVPGFGSGLRPGFLLPIPETLRDGQPHVAHVSFGETDTMLDGAPIEFALDRALPVVELVAQQGSRITLRLRQTEDSPVTPEGALQVFADGALVETERRGADYILTVPNAAQWLVAALPDGTLLARFRVTGGDFVEDPARDLPADALSEAGCAAARAAFDTFCADPDDRFDPLWYRWAHPGTYGLEDDAALLAHYRDIGARAGRGPGPWFDEATARQRYPALAGAIEKGDLPCAFAVELALGRGALDTLNGTDPATARSLAMGREEAEESLFEDAIPPAAPAPLPTRLPPAVAAQSPSDAIYAAWVSRLQLSDAQRAEIADDDYRMRRDIAAVALTRQPLVSIIMPSWNRAFTIGEAIQSVLDQSYPNWELIVCDDASEDRTAEVVRGFDDPRIRYMRFIKSNGAGARNKGLHHARGEYIAYLDSDNIWHPLFLDMMLRQLLAQPGRAIAYCAYLDTEISGAHVSLQAIPRPNFRPIPLSSKNFMDLNTIVHHRRIYDWLGGFDGNLPRLQDWDLSLRYTSVFRPIYVNRIGVFYRRNVAWGQVTHLFMGGDAQNTVNEKTQARLDGAHERLTIDWPGRARVTLLCGGPEGQRPSLRDLAVTRALAHLIAPVADIDLVELGGDPDLAPPPGSLPAAIQHHAIPEALQRAPHRLGGALDGLLTGRAILTIGLSASQLRSMPDLDTSLVWRVRNSGEGSVLQAMAAPAIQYDLGALPISLPKPAHEPENLCVLALLPEGRQSEIAAVQDKLRSEALKRDLTLLVPPGAGHGWLRIDKSGETTLAIDPGTGLPEAVGQVSVTASLAPVSELDAFSLGLLNALQARGVPAAVLNDKGRARATGFARQWIEARAAYEIQVNEPKWIAEKLRKLLSDAAGMERLAERSRIVHSIAWHPDLVQQRLCHALYCIQHEDPQQEVIDALG